MSHLLAVLGCARTVHIDVRAEERHARMRCLAEGRALRETSPVCERVFWEGLATAEREVPCAADDDCIAQFFPESPDAVGWFALPLDWRGRSEFRTR